MSFHVGQKIICVDSQASARGLKENGTYTVKKVYPAHFRNGDDGLDLIDDIFWGSPWRASRFRDASNKVTERA